MVCRKIFEYQGLMMKTKNMEQLRMDISEAFDFARFLIKNPKMLKKIKNGSEIRFTPAVHQKMPHSYHPPKNVQAFVAETIFHSL